MKCHKCKQERSATWYYKNICRQCHLDDIPDHIPEEQHLIYLMREKDAK